MARSFTSSPYLTTTNLPVSGASFTVNLWFYPLVSNQWIHLWNITDPLNSTDYFTLATGGNGLLFVDARTPGNAQSTVYNSAFALNTWQMATYVEEGNYRDCFLNGVPSGAANVDTQAGANITQMFIGAWGRNPLGGYFQGRICQVAIYSARLSDAEVLTLFSNNVATSPENVRPDLLVSHYPLFDADGDVDYAGGFDLTPVNSPGYAEHVPLIWTLPSAKPAEVGGPPAKLNVAGQATFTEAGSGDIVKTSPTLNPAGQATFSEAASGDIIKTAATLNPAGQATFTEAGTGAVLKPATLNPAGQATFTEAASGDITKTAPKLNAAGQALFTEAASGDVELLPKLSAAGQATFSEAASGGIFVPPSAAICRRVGVIPKEIRTARV